MLLDMNHKELYIYKVRSTTQPTIPSQTIQSTRRS